MWSTWVPMVSTGLKAFIAPWKTIANSAPRSAFSSRFVISVVLCPRNRTVPPAIRPGGGTICSSEYASVDLPQPDSPTRA